MARLTKMQELIVNTASEVENYTPVVKIIDAIATELGAVSWSSCGSAVLDQFDNSNPNGLAYIDYKETFICFLLAMTRADLVAFFQTFTTIKLK